MSTPGQIKKIKTLQGKLGLGDEGYKLLLSNYWVKSCTELTDKEAGDLIDKLEAMAVEQGVWTPKPRTDKKYDNLAKRDGFATPKQCRMIEAMFREVSWYKDKPKAFDHAFRNFLHRIAHVDDVTFVVKEDVSKVIKALERMQDQRRNDVQ